MFEVNKVVKCIIYLKLYFKIFVNQNKWFFKMYISKKYNNTFSEDCSHQISFLIKFCVKTFVLYYFLVAMDLPLHTMI